MRHATARWRAWQTYVGAAMLLGLAAVVGLFTARWQQGGQRSTTVAGANPAPAVGVQTNEVTLYYVGEDGMSLVESRQELPLGPGQDTLVRARLVADRQLAEAPPPLTSPFPPGTRVRAIFLTPGGDAFVDLSADVSRSHPGGSLDELLTVYALVNALVTNVPEITAVQILIDGREVDTLAGHVDLRHPLERNTRWVAEPGTPDTGERPTDG